MYPFVDNLLSFRTKMYNLDKLNLYQFLIQRIGVGNSLSWRIAITMGYSPFYKSKKIKKTSKSIEAKQFFINNSKFFDKNIKKLESSNIDRLYKNKSYRGIKHKYKLPTRGQRTRSNAKTRSNLRKGKKTRTKKKSIKK